MKKSLLFIIATFSLIFAACTNAQTQTGKTSLTASEFAQKIKQAPEAAIVDVRTPEEFEKGHLEQALNYDWNGEAFEQQVGKLDKNKPVLVYCLSGGRSREAAAQMRKEGFKEVYELNGGIMKWRAAGLPEINGNPSVKGLTMEQFDAMKRSDKLVLVDFYADWCGPCKKMKPYLEEIAKDMADKVTVIRINADDNQELCRELHVEALPILHLYKEQQLIWVNEGFIEKESVIDKLR